MMHKVDFGTLFLSLDRKNKIHKITKKIIISA